ncbi:hypothetical protein BpHYR1_037794 [Brachionus plicatilis]|uniref:Uncharacterized protein n=1 Tax=Brachionus plicatilis TaxID=10195 RepID=A0A3M7PBC7_BRAPC|nr:hypothetical protein BpHYR1_037794 [Brachionus plicatilis]
MALELRSHSTRLAHRPTAVYSEKLAFSLFELSLIVCSFVKLKHGELGAQLVVNAGQSIVAEIEKLERGELAHFVRDRAYFVHRQVQAAAQRRAHLAHQIAAHVQILQVGVEQTEVGGHLGQPVVRHIEPDEIAQKEHVRQLKLLGRVNLRPVIVHVKLLFGLVQPIDACVLVKVECDEHVVVLLGLGRQRSYHQMLEFVAAEVKVTHTVGQSVGHQVEAVLGQTQPDKIFEQTKFKAERVLVETVGRQVKISEAFFELGIVAKCVGELAQPVVAERETAQGLERGQLVRHELDVIVVEPELLEHSQLLDVRGHVHQSIVAQVQHSQTVAKTIERLERHFVGYVGKDTVGALYSPGHHRPVGHLVQQLVVLGHVQLGQIEQIARHQLPWQQALFVDQIVVVRQVKRRGDVPLVSWLPDKLSRSTLLNTLSANDRAAASPPNAVSLLPLRSRSRNWPNLLKCSRLTESIELADRSMRVRLAKRSARACGTCLNELAPSSSRSMRVTLRFRLKSCWLERASLSSASEKCCRLASVSSRPARLRAGSRASAHSRSSSRWLSRSSRLASESTAIATLGSQYGTSLNT